VSPSIFSVLVWAAFFNLFLPFWLQLLQLRQQPGRYLAYAVFNATLRGVLTVAAVAYLRAGAAGWAMAYLVSGAVSSCIAVVATRKSVSLVGALRMLPEALSYGLPLLAHQLAAFLAVYAGRFVLNQLTTLSDVGVYQVAFGIGQGIGLLTTAVNFAYAPAFMASAVSTPKVASARFGKFATYYLSGLVAIAVILSIYRTPILGLIATPRFAQASDLVPILLGAFVLQGVYYVLVNPIFLEKRLIRLIPIVTFTSAVIGISGSYLLIPRLGISGAAWAGLLANCVSVLLTYRIASAALVMDYDYRKIFTIVGIGAIATAASFGVASITSSKLVVAALDSTLVAVFLAGASRWTGITPRAVWVIANEIIRPAQPAHAVSAAGIISTGPQ
jgi:O-antigen/teichoic acid export membrane protein